MTSSDMTSSDIRIAQAPHSNAAIEERIVQALKEHSGAVTTADIVVRTGLPALVLEPVFRDMVLRYDCTVDVTADGQLRYVFAPPFTPLSDPNNLARMRLKRSLWRAFVTLFKIAIMVVLVGYVVVFIVLAVLAFAAMLSKNSDDNRRSGPASRGNSSGYGGGMSMDPSWIWLVGDRRAPRPRRGRFDAPPPTDPRPFYEKIFSFVFGVQTPDNDPLLDDKQLLAWIVAERGVISPLELSARTGWSPRASERESSKLIASFDGGVELLPDGATLFAFDDLRDHIPSGTPPIPMFWDRWEFKETTTGNSGSTNTLIIALNLFVLFGAIFLVPALIEPALQLGADEGLLWVVLVGFPALYVATFFTVPALRAATTVRKENRAREERNLRRLALREIYERARRGQTMLREFDIVDAAMRRTPAQIALPVSLQKSLTRVVREIAFEWEAPADIDDRGDRVYDFGSIQRSLENAAAYRARPGSLASARMHDSFAAFDAALNAPKPAPAAADVSWE